VLISFADIQIFREGLKYVRTIAQNEPLKSLLGPEISPGPSVVTDEDWDKWISTAFATEYHPAASCAMLPKSQGGVVNAKLQVYGLSKCSLSIIPPMLIQPTANVRVVDSSVFPFAFSAHVRHYRSNHIPQS
jgi:choline dehydrogenase